jgi:NAD-dependent DNA ligase
LDRLVRISKMFGKNKEKIQPDGEKIKLISLRRNWTKKLESVFGVCAGLMADNQLNADEIGFFYQFLLDNQELLKEWPYWMFANKINDILEDGIITQKEKEDLETMIREFLGGTLQETGATSGLSTMSGVDYEADIIFKDRVFVLTGQFKFGKRFDCSAVTQAHGGTVKDTISSNIDYLVIGNLGSDHWIEANYGRKIQKAQDVNNTGGNIIITSEICWEKALNKSVLKELNY